MEIVARKDARERGLDHYFTGKLCIHGHCEVRKTSTKRCVQCNRDHVNQWGRDNPDKVKARNKRDAKMIAEASKKAKLKKPEKYKALRVVWLEKNKDRHYAAIAAAKKKKPEKYKALSRAWEEKNRDHVRDRHRKWENENKIELRKKQQLWRDQNRDHVNARRREWSAKNKESVAANSKIQQARRRAAQGTFSKQNISDILKAQRGRCAYFKICGAKFTCDDGYEIDHILAVSKGGSSDPNNIQLLCSDCNKRKNAKDAIEFMQSRGFLL